MPSNEYVDFLKVQDIAKKERIKVEKILDAAGKGHLPLFVQMPEELKARRIDVQSNDLPMHTQLFHNPVYDNYSPVLLRLKPACCAKLSTAEKIDATEFPYAICVTDGYSHLTKDGNEGGWRRSYVEIVQIPPYQEVYPMLLDDAKVCWRLFDPETQDFSAFAPLTVSRDMVVTRNDYMDRVQSLRQTGNRKQLGKTTERYTERHERPRRLLAEIAEQVAQDLPADCGTLTNWASAVFDLRDGTRFEDLRKIKPRIGLRWIQDVLRLKYELVDGKPVRKMSTEPD